ncbi:hypothetical protein [Streptacidiphilus neutrinimicus]|uniref:hypothetical protein n=1 Tax=Streptacidiphilus neutrinimicus TaxID=105420 RepID=UPI0005A692B6|nr:hypothetical protein [Streptacidiphilus neutrinimicus]
MTQLIIPRVWLTQDTLLVSTDTLSGLVRAVAAEVTGWEGQGADPATLRAFDQMLQSLADRIDVECIALASTVAEGDGWPRAREPKGTRRLAYPKDARRPGQKGQQT